MSLIDRRTFMQSLGAAVPVLACGQPPADTPATGNADPRLEPFDRLMTAFLSKHDVPGAALAVARQGKLAYARGFGYADVDAKRPVRPASLFRIASISKPITAAAVLRLVERDRLGLDDPVLKHVKLKPYLAAGAKPDPRWHRVTVRHCLQHTGGWDRGLPKTGYDPIGIPRRIARALDIPPAVPPAAVVRYMLGRPLDFDPGTRYAYSNLGYLLLGRVIEAVSGQPYAAFVQKEVFDPVGISGISLARALPEHRPTAEVRYYTADGGTAPCLYPPREGKPVPRPDGGENTEAYEAHGGWVASAPDLLRFAAAFGERKEYPVLRAATVETMFARPAGPAGADEKGEPRDVYYGCGWNVRIRADGTRNTWHTGATAGQSSILVRRFDGLAWAVLFNRDRSPDGQSLASLIDERLHEAANAVKDWPDVDLFGRLKEAG